MNRKPIHEIFFLRAIACLSIVLLHSVTRVYDDEGAWVQYVKLLLAFGTPIFIFISELLLAYAYPLYTPKGFFTKRIRYILMPFLCFTILYSIQDTFTGTGTGKIDEWLSNLGKGLFLGETPGYFVLIIFQFYILHILFQRYIFNTWRPYIVLLSTGIINITYLAIFNFTQPINHEFAFFFWDRAYRMPFLGWIFYFAVAYYCGRQWDRIKELLDQNRMWLIASVPASAALLFYSLHEGWIPVISSKRIDMIPFALSMAFVLMWAASRMKKISQVWIQISQYSFGIYLIHPLVYSILGKALEGVPFWRNSVLGVVILFSIAITVSIGAVIFLNKWRVGAYIIGRIGANATNVRSESISRKTDLRSTSG